MTDQIEQFEKYPPSYKFRWKAGPYTPPPQVKAGDKVLDEWRGEVEVAGMTDALIPWPAFLHLGKLLPILTGDLVRAVAEESEATITHYWGVSRYHIGEWKKALTGATTKTEVFAALALLKSTPEWRKKHGYSR